jgi:hypothetical protein
MNAEIKYEMAIVQVFLRLFLVMKKNMYLGLILGPGRGRGMKKEEEFWVVK